MVLSIVALSQRTPWLPSKLGEGEKPSSERLRAAGEASFLAEVLLDAQIPAEMPRGI